MLYTFGFCTISNKYLHIHAEPYSKFLTIYACLSSAERPNLLSKSNYLSQVCKQQRIPKLILHVRER